MNYTLSVLVVEDDPNDQALLDDVLRRTKVPLAARFVRTSAEAIAILEACARGECDWPHVIFLDLALQGSSGFSVLQWLDETGRRSETAVIVLSGSVDPEDVQAARAQGAQAYLSKMPHPAVLAHILRSPTLRRETPSRRH